MGEQPAASATFHTRLDSMDVEVCFARREQMGDIVYRGVEQPGCLDLSGHRQRGRKAEGRVHRWAEHAGD